MSISRRAVLGGLAAGLVPAASGCSIFSTSTIRYRMTVEVDTPLGRRSGSSVVESFLRDAPKIAEAGGVRAALRGQAAVIALPRGILFALLGKVGEGSPSDYFAEILPKALAHDQSQPPMSRKYVGGEWKAQRAEARRKHVRLVLKEQDYPTFVKFKDFIDPNTVREITPDNISEAFGRGTSIRAVYLQVTDDPVTSGISSVLPWIARLQGVHLNGQSSEGRQSPFSGRVGTGHFSVGVDN